MSRLRSILLTDSTALEVERESLLVVQQLGDNNVPTRRQLQASLKVPMHRAPFDLEVPSLFKSMVDEAVGSSNRHFKQLLIVSFMDFEPEIFGRWMLAGESEQLQEQFMKVNKETLSQWITGLKPGGSLFTADDTLHLRKAGPVMAFIRDQFVTL